MTDGATHTMSLTGRQVGLDDTVAARAARGESRAFAQIVAAHQGRVARVVHRLLGWPDEVEDVVQDVFVAALKSLPSFRGEASLPTWLLAIAVNQCRSHQRRQLVRQKFLAAARRLAAPRAPRTAGSRAMDREKHQLVRQAVRRLPLRLREVVVLHYLEEMPLEGIARVLDLSRSAVGTRLHRARKRLAEDLSGRFEE